ncbi:MAG: VpsP family polysaccharide biosynthesis protein [Thalassotalea sp.]|nr:VpsP family polysaccharide biosynthesis protein [Thalassotalea sp.]
MNSIVTTPPAKSLFNKLVLVTLAVICCFGALKAYNLGTANLAFYRAHQIVEYWQEQQKVSNDADYQVALDSMLDATQKHPNNPQYLITLGLVYEWGGLQAISQNKSAEPYFRQAEQAYLTAVHYRPTWPGTWATLAILKWRLGEIDDEMISYLQLADKFGENTPQVHSAWVDLGFLLYKTKSPFIAKVINDVRKHLASMLANPKTTSEAIDIAKRHGAERLACSWAMSSDKLTEDRKEAVCRLLTSS